ncbi:MAG: Asp-tRNA(Asn)/Glu-tRNA(Gln) amidotransferase subunit GatB [Patescibacteria group bacterium]
MIKYEAVIGLEIHIQLATKSKMFCGSDNKDTLEPNVNVCPICMGHPGTLPAVNREAVEMGIILGLALNCEINKETKFDRKHYFYPDLPKGYQISQYDEPLAKKGTLMVYPDGLSGYTIRINRLHLEEDAAKNIHTANGTLIDFNRAGTPLAEIVTEPDIKTPLEARLFLQELQMIARYLNVSNADMEKGNLRCDANISMRPVGEDALYPKIEIKNLNSFRSVEHALKYEIERQAKLWEENNAPEKEETRGWDEKKQETVLQRTKEDAADYRYFPEPDIPPLTFTDQEIQTYKMRLPELPHDRRERFKDEYFLNYVDAKVITSDPRVSDFYENSISELRAWLNSLDNTNGSDDEIWNKNGEKLCRIAKNWLTTDIFGLLAKTNQDFRDLKITPENFAEFITLIYENKINSSAAQAILKIMFDRGADPSQVMEEENLEQIQDQDSLSTACDEAIKINPVSVEDFKNGKDKALMFLVGQVMKQMKGKANPQIITDLLRDKLK